MLLDYEKYSVKQVLKAGLSYEELTILEWVNHLQGEGLLTRQMNEKGVSFWVVSFAAMKSDCNRVFKCSPDNINRRSKGLERDGFIEVLKGRYMCDRYGFQQFAFRLTDKHKKLLKK